MEVIKTGKVTVKRLYGIREFNEDDGWIIKTVLPGEYDYRVLNVVGWKPRQLKVGAEWLDVADEIAELEEIICSEGLRQE